MAEQSYSQSRGFLLSSYGKTDVSTAAVSTGLRGLYTGGYGFTLTSVSAIVTTDIVSPDNTVLLEVVYDPSYDASPAVTVIGTITIPSGATAGDIYTLNLDYDAFPAERLFVRLARQAAGTDAAGDVFVMLEGFNFPYPAEPDGVAKASGDGKVFLVES